MMFLVLFRYFFAVWSKTHLILGNRAHLTGFTGAKSSVQNDQVFRPKGVGELSGEQSPKKDLCHHPLVKVC